MKERAEEPIAAQMVERKINETSDLNNPTAT